MFNRIFLFYFPTFNRINSTNDSYESVKNYVIMPFIVKLVNINFLLHATADEVKLFNFFL